MEVSAVKPSVSPPQPQAQGKAQEIEPRRDKEPVAREPQATRPAEQARQPQQAERNQRPERAERPEPPKPVVNAQGQKTGTIINTTA